VVWFGAAALLPGCSRSPEPVPCSPAKYGYVPTNSHREEVAAAVAMANNVLPATTQLVLDQPSGAPTLAASVAGIESIPVWTVAERNLGLLDVAFVPEGCRAVILQTPALFARIAAWNGDPKTALDVEPPSAVAWLLLHEAGHLAEGRGGNFEAAPMVRGVNFSDTPDKRRESAADHYAATLVKNGVGNRELSRMLASNRIAMALNNLSWNLERDRLLDDFAATALGLPHAFGDPAYTHPNLEFRILVANAWINPSDASEKLVEEFVRGRASVTEKQ
jgi:hypothetical protein